MDEPKKIPFSKEEKKYLCDLIEKDVNPFYFGERVIYHSKENNRKEINFRMFLKDKVKSAYYESW